MKRIIVLCVILNSIAVFAGGASGEKWYHITDHGKKVGYLKVTESKVDDRKDQRLFIHNLVLRQGEESINMEMKTFCKNDKYYSPVEIKGSGTGRNSISFHLTFNNGKMKIESAKDETEKEVPDNIVSSLLLLEIVSGLPFDKNSEYSFNSLEVPEVNLKLNHKIHGKGKNRCGATAS